MPGAKGVSPRETLNTTGNYTQLTDKGGGKASVYCALMLYCDTSSALLFGYCSVAPSKCGKPL